MRPLTRRQIAWRAAQDLADGAYVNLGLGMPVLVAAEAPAGREVVFHSENGIVGVGPLADEAAANPDLVDAGSQQVTLAAGAAIVDSAAAFAMIRGGHVDVTLLGGFRNFTGPIVGALFYNHISATHALSFLQIPAGVLLIAVIVFLPRGIVGTFLRVVEWARRRRRPEP